MSWIDRRFAIKHGANLGLALLALAPMKAATAQAPTPPPIEFDGLWQVTQDCPVLEKAPGYSRQFGMVVKNGFARAQWGTEGTADSMTLSGQIRPDGTATLVTNGLTGQPSSAFESPPRTPIGYTIAANFLGNKGLGNRKQARPCTFTFAKQEAAGTGGDGERRAKAEEEAKAKAEAGVKAKAEAEARQQAARTSANPFDGEYIGDLSCTDGFVQARSFNVVGGKGSISWKNTRCNADVTETLTVDPDGAAMLQAYKQDAQCKLVSGSVSGRIENKRVQFAFKGALGQSCSVNLTRREDGSIAEEADKKKAEVTETALRLGDKDRQKIQVALTSLGFATGNPDGSFGLRSRQMIAAWQEKNNAPATGFLSAAQRDQLFQNAAPAIARWEVEQKKLDDEKKKADEAKAAAAAPATAVATPAPSAPAVASTSGGAFDGSYTFSLDLGSGLRRTGKIRITHGRGVGATVNPGCGNIAIAFTVSPAGDVAGSWDGFLDNTCKRYSYVLAGSAQNGRIRFTTTGPNGKGTGEMIRVGD